MPQATWDNFDDGEFEETEDVKKDYGIKYGKNISQYLSDDADFNDPLSCPWCLHPSDDIEDGSCPNCEAEIPENADWYQNGEKVVI